MALFVAKIATAETLFAPFRLWKRELQPSAAHITTTSMFTRVNSRLFVQVNLLGLNVLKPMMISYFAAQENA